MWILELNNQAVAYEYHLAYKGRIHGLRSAYQENFREFSPGSFLDHQIMWRLYEMGDFHEYDMGGNADFYKLRWTRDSRKHKSIYIFHKNMYSKMIYLLYNKIVPLLRPIKSIVAKK